MRDYTSRRISNYEGFKRLDKLLEKIDAGVLTPPRKIEPDFYCPLCHYRRRSQRLVRSEVLGSRLPPVLRVTPTGVTSPNPFAPEAKFIVVCEGCAEDLERSNAVRGAT